MSGWMWDGVQASSASWGSSPQSAMCQRSSSKVHRPTSLPLSLSSVLNRFLLPSSVPPSLPPASSSCPLTLPAALVFFSLPVGPKSQLMPHGLCTLCFTGSPRIREAPGNPLQSPQAQAYTPHSTCALFELFQP